MIITEKTTHHSRPSRRPNANGRSDRTRVNITTNRRYHAVHYARKSRGRRNYLHAARDRSIQSQQLGPTFVQSSHLWRSRRSRSLIVSTDVIKSYTSNNYNSSAPQLRVLTRIFDSTKYSGATPIRSASRAPERRITSLSPTSSLRLHYGLGGYSHRKDEVQHPKIFVSCGLNN